MPWLRCTVEQAGPADPLRGEFEGRSVYECAWAALCEWATLSHSGRISVLTVRNVERVWHVRQEKVVTWRALVRDDMARQRMHEAKLRDPEGLEKL